jgi:hypothetical protein
MLDATAATTALQFNVVQTEITKKNGDDNSNNRCEVVVVGCGAPSRGMGWYHAEQMLKGKCPSTKLSYIVEPWFLGPGTYREFVSLVLDPALCSHAEFLLLFATTGASSPSGPDFTEFRNKAEAEQGVKFLTRLEDILTTETPTNHNDSDNLSTKQGRRLALLSSRPEDNPALLHEAIKVRSC